MSDDYLNLFGWRGRDVHEPFERVVQSYKSLGTPVLMPA
jgi:hypothetical protein